MDRLGSRIWSVLSALAGQPVLWLVGILHLITGIALVLDSRVALVTGLRFIAGHSSDLAGLGFIGTGLLSLWAVTRAKRVGPGPETFWALVVAQSLLFLVAGGVIAAVVQGSYASGTVLPRSFIFTDQLSKLLLMVFHPLAVYKLHRPIIRGVNDVSSGG